MEDHVSPDQLFTDLIGRCLHEKGNDKGWRTLPSEVKIMVVEYYLKNAVYVDIEEAASSADDTLCQHMTYSGVVLSWLSCPRYNACTRRKVHAFLDEWTGHLQSLL
jgi:hypothetical protein